MVARRAEESRAEADHFMGMRRDSDEASNDQSRCYRSSSNQAFFRDMSCKNSAVGISSATAGNNIISRPRDSASASSVFGPVTVLSAPSLKTFQMHTRPNKDAQDQTKINSNGLTHRQHQHQDRGEPHTGQTGAVRSGWTEDKNLRQEDYESDEMRDSDDDDNNEDAGVLDARAVSSIVPVTGANRENDTRRSGGSGSNQWTVHGIVVDEFSMI